MKTVCKQCNATPSGPLSLQTINLQ